MDHGIYWQHEVGMFIRRSVRNIRAGIARYHHFSEDRTVCSNGVVPRLSLERVASSHLSRYYYLHSPKTMAAPPHKSIEDLSGHWLLVGLLPRESTLRNCFA